jgi:hypothetical protein
MTCVPATTPERLAVAQRHTIIQPERAHGASVHVPSITVVIPRKAEERVQPMQQEKLDGGNPFEAALWFSQSVCMTNSPGVQMPTASSGPMHAGKHPGSHVADPKPSRTPVV